jgi:DNA-binding transcriptional LysR family regulator
METRRLRLLLELSRLGSMREVAEEVHVTTSTVSQQLAVLAKEAGAQLFEPDGRRVRLTPAGRRLAAHAVTILAAVDAARLDLDPRAEPAGELRVAAFATAVRHDLLPLVPVLAREHPRVTLRLAEHEPLIAYGMLESDRIDLALTCDFDLAPAEVPATLESRQLWQVPWGVGVPAATAATSFGELRDADWVVDSRHTGDDEVVRTLAAVSGFTPRIVHRVDSLDLVQELIVAGLGVALLPEAMALRDGVRMMRLGGPAVMMRCHAVIRRGRAAWPALALILGLLEDQGR